jgi:hypothetical protein
MWTMDALGCRSWNDLLALPRDSGVARRFGAGFAG